MSAFLIILIAFSFFNFGLAVGLATKQSKGKK